ncbi:hypothetical protein NQ318_013748 [Aromia moschata]|uniref:Uncharacterized protein n=1 Tax=Aromia moschata TaxID=1265417 RepID=A0AAV8Z899_9CUCU|nr:hypothetical protein NQ318_013748 [Aromia moschata]
MEVIWSGVEIAKGSTLKNFVREMGSRLPIFCSLYEVKSLKGTRFESVEAVKAKATEVLNQLEKRTSSTAFNNGKLVWSGVEIAKGRKVELGAANFVGIYINVLVKPRDTWWTVSFLVTNERPLSTTSENHRWKGFKKSLMADISSPCTLATLAFFNFLRSATLYKHRFNTGQHIKVSCKHRGDFKSIFTRVKS